MADENHVIGSGLTEQELQVASWWVRHGDTMRKVGRGALIAIAVLLWGFALWGLLDAYVISYPRETAIGARVLNNQFAKPLFDEVTPQPLQPSETQTFQSKNNRLDFLAALLNQNKRWWAEFDYHFDVSGASTPLRKGYILPDSERYLSEIGWDASSTAGGTGNVVIENVSWHRLDPKIVGQDYPGYAAARAQLMVDQVTYNNDLVIGTERVGQTAFLLRNPSGFGFWAVNLTVVLYRGGVPTAVTVLTEKNILPGESRPITINWLDNPTNISRTEIQPTVNILDLSTFLPPGGP